MKIQQSARKEMDLFKFELIYPKIVSKQERKEIEKDVIASREEKWKKALKKLMEMKRRHSPSLIFS